MEEIGWRWCTIDPTRCRMNENSKPRHRRIQWFELGNRKIYEIETIGYMTRHGIENGWE